MGCCCCLLWGKSWLSGRFLVLSETDDLDSLVKSMADSGHEFRNKIREELTFKYVMIAGPDDLLIELFECFEPVRWGIEISEPQP